MGATRSDPFNEFYSFVFNYLLLICGLSVLEESVGFIHMYALSFTLIQFGDRLELPIDLDHAKPLPPHFP